MTDKLEDLLAAEFRNGSYELSVDADRLTTTLRRRRARRNTATVAGAGVALAATIGVGVGYLGGPGAVPTPPADPVTATSAASVVRRLTPDTVRIGDAVLRGLPADAKLATDPGAALAEPPAVVLPATGDRAVFTVPSRSATTIRLVVVAGAEQGPGLPGFPADDQSWLGALGGAHSLLMVDDPTHTTYLSTTTPAGQRWHLAASGPDEAARLALIRTVATATVPAS